MKATKPWFVMEGRGDRTLAQQMQGLDLLLESVNGKTVLDVGCAEGLIDFELIKAGAVAVHGVENRPQAVKDANALRGRLACTFEQGDANTWHPKRSYNVLLLLAILHKLREPDAACLRFIKYASDMVVIRLPPNHLNPCVLDGRSGGKLFMLSDHLSRAGFGIKRVEHGYLGEWIGYYTRRL